MKNLFLLFLAVWGFFLCDQPSLAGDTQGRFGPVGGVGRLQCSEFVGSMEKARALGRGTVEYVQETEGFTMYLQGFRLGYNLAKEDTCDLFAGEENNYRFLAWAENWCRDNPTSSFGNAVVALSIDLFPKRQKVCGK